jgi:uncharacterized protein (TIGR03067 family)
MKRLFLSILVVVAIATAVVGCKSNDTSSGNTDLQGTWMATAPDDNTMTITCAFNGNQWTMTEAIATVGSIQLSGTFTVDSAANPKTIDMLFTSFPMETDWVGKTSLGIYEISGNSLNLCMGDPGETRPTSFTEDDTLTFVKQ